MIASKPPAEGTPRTDAALKRINMETCVSVDFARQLERELQAERQRCEASQKALVTMNITLGEVIQRAEQAESRAASATALLLECREYIKRFNKAHDRNAILAAIDAALSAGGDDGK